VVLPSGATGVAGAGVQPSVQFPWSWELRDGWSLAGMITEFFRPLDPISQLVTQATFVIEKKVSEKAGLFTDVGYYPDNSGSRQLINSGGTYRITPTQQVDFHVALGLNHRALISFSVSGTRSAWIKRARGAKRSAVAVCRATGH
jgi:hypothetical protein